MNRRTTLVLLILNVLVFAGLVLTRDRGVAAGRQTLLPADLDLGPTTGIRFSAGKGWPAIELVLGKDRRWHLDRGDGPLANQAAVKGLFDNLRRAPILPFETGADQDLGLDPPRRTVTFSRPEGKPFILALGRVHPLGLGVFVRIRGEEKNHLSSPELASLLDRQPGNFRELRIFPFGPLEINRLVLRRETLSGPQVIEAERKWLTWFIEKPRRLRGDTNAFDGIRSALLGIRRQGSAGAPEARPSLVATLTSDTDSVTLDIWVTDGKHWIGRVRGEPSGFLLNPHDLEPALLIQFRLAWDKHLFFDPSEQVGRVEWRFKGREPIAVVRDRAHADVWNIVEPRKAGADREACNQFVQELMRLEVDGIDPPGTRPADVGLAPGFGTLTVHFLGGAGREQFRIGTPRAKEVRICRENDPENIFRLHTGKLGLLPRSALELVDRTLYQGDWKRVSQVDIRRGPAERFRLKNVGVTEERHWQRTDVSESPQVDDAFVAGTPMRNLITHLTESLRGSAVLAWTTKNARPEWGIERPSFVVAFPDTDPTRSRRIQVAIGRRQADRAGRPWYPAWLMGEALSDRPYVYKIDDELVRKIGAVLPND